MISRRAEALVAAALAGGIGAAGADEAPAPPDAGPALVEYAVINAALAESLGGTDLRPVLFDVTTAHRLFAGGDPERRESLADALEVDAACLDRYASRNRAEHELDNLFALPVEHTLITEAAFLRLFDRSPEEGWKRFYERYPDSLGTVRVSRVGLCDGDRTALVYVEHGCGPECGTGRFLALVRHAGGWRVEAVFRQWRLTDTLRPSERDDE